MEINVEIKDAEVKSMLERLISRVKKATPAFREVGQIVRRSVIRNFEVGGRPEKWKPLAAATILKGIRKKEYTRTGTLKAYAKRRITGRKILVDTGTLRNSISVEAYPDRAVVGPKGSIPYARIHQLGGQAGRGHKVNIPARPYLMVQDEDWIEIKNALVRYLEGK